METVEKIRIGWKKMINSTVCVVTVIVCLTIIKIYRLSIEKAEKETKRATAFTEMYKAEQAARLRPVQSPGHKN